MRRKVNLKFLGCLVLGLVLFGGGVHLVHALQVKSNASGLRHQADLAEEEERLADVQKYLQRYLAYVPDDVEAMARLGLTLDKLAKHGATPVTRRVVEQGKVITAAGVSSGIDMALTLAARVADEDTARAIQLAIEYDPQPPYDAGAADRAPAEIVSRLRARSRFLLSGRSS